MVGLVLLILNVIDLVDFVLFCLLTEWYLIVCELVVVILNGVLYAVQLVVFCLWYLVLLMFDLLLLLDVFSVIVMLELYQLLLLLGDVGLSMWVVCGVVVLLLLL